MCGAVRRTFFSKKEEIMERERRNIHIGKAVIACLLITQLAGPLSNMALAVFSDPRVTSFLLYWETGRVIRLEAAPTVPAATEPATTPATVPTTQPPKLPLAFAAYQAEGIQTSNFTGYDPDLGALLATPLTWDLTQDGPAVLILHTHATESYTGVPGYRTEDPDANMLRVGREIARVLEENGIGVIHDTTLHDKPSYNGSYIYARETIEARLEEYPSIRMVLDIHRDALELTESVQLSTHAVVDGQDSAQLMLVMGTDAGNRDHPAWQENLAVAAKLQVLLEEKYPGICRRMQLRTERFNQDLSRAGMLVEVGAAGDTLEEALVAARAFAGCIVELAQGAVIADSTS